MERFFNTAGPIKKENHYSIDPLSRIHLKDILSLIRQEKFFVLHAPRQTGKTSYLLALMEYLNRGDRYKCLYVNVEAAQAARGNVKEGIRSILGVLSSDAFDYLDDPFMKENWEAILKIHGEFAALQELLKEWAKAGTKPIVLMIDEIDSLVGDTLISTLLQLRSGYYKRPALFPQSVILCGVRDRSTAESLPGIFRETI